MIQEVSVYLQEKENAQEEARLAQEMVEEMINSQNNNQQDDRLVEVREALQNNPAWVQLLGGGASSTFYRFFGS